MFILRGLCSVLALALLVLASTASADPATDILMRRPLPPTDIALFVPGAYPAAPPLVPAPGPPPTEAQVLSMLQAYLAVEFPGDSHAQADGLALFNDPVAKAKIPNPSLRAALVGLKGTIGEPAIDFYLNAKTSEGLPKVAAVLFDDQNLAIAGAVANAFIDINTNQVYVVFEKKYIGERPWALTSVLAHEALHLDVTVASFEEVIASTLETTVYLQQLSKHPEIAHAGSELTRHSNSIGLARLNSGLGARLGLYASNGDLPVLPGGASPAKSWWALILQVRGIVGGFVPTPGNGLLGQYLAPLQEPGQPVCSPASYNQALLDCLDQNAAALTRKQLVAAAVALRLDTGPPALLIDLAKESLRPGDTLSLRAILAPSAASGPVDAYIALQVGGVFYSLQENGSLAPGILPWRSNITPPFFSGEVLRLTVPPGTPPGQYTWYAALTAAGTANIIGAIDEEIGTVLP